MTDFKLFVISISVSVVIMFCIVLLMRIIASLC